MANDPDEDRRPDIAEKAALVYLLFGHLLPDGGERMVQLMDEHDDVDRPVD